MNAHRIAAFAALIIHGTAMSNPPEFASLKPTAEMVLEAKKNPNGWVYAIEGNFGRNEAVPPEAIAGAWKVDSAGNIVANSFQANPKYKPLNSRHN
jgi:hypothetical protein